MIAVIGANSQLGKCFINSTNYKVKQYLSSDLNLKNIKNIDQSFDPKRFDAVINFSAFNNVEDAEKNADAFILNHLAVERIAELCSKNKIFLIHISTDYVFDGLDQFYDETYIPNPINKYGLSKLLGEQAIRKYCEEHIIIRTSWLYSNQLSQNNFLYKIKKMLDQNSNTFFGVIDSFGSPTSALNLANGIEIVLNQFFNSSLKFGTYHFADIGNVSRYDFLKKILIELSTLKPHKKIDLEKVTNSYFNLVAPRPKNTSLNSELFSKEFHYEFESWDNALIKTIEKL